jgi:hypothetical protein
MRDPSSLFLSNSMRAGTAGAAPGPISPGILDPSEPASGHYIRPRSSVRPTKTRATRRTNTRANARCQQSDFAEVIRSLRRAEPGWCASSLE